MREIVEKASVLVEALPYITKFRGATFVVKYGGVPMIDPELRATFARDITLLKYVGVNPVIVHGGGPQIDEMLARLGIESRFVRGLRITDDQTMDVVEMVLVGLVNKRIVTDIQRCGGQAVGLSGKDAGLLLARRMTPLADTGARGAELVDPGKVGDVDRVNAQVLKKLDEAGYIPVVAPVGVDEDGGGLNINADHVAAAVAGAIRAEKLVMLTDVPGVLDRDGTLLSSLPQSAARRVIAEGVVKGGMIPKLECALRALDQGVGKVHIIDGRVPHAVLLEIFTDRGVGTEVLADRGAT